MAHDYLAPWFVLLVLRYWNHAACDSLAIVVGHLCSASSPRYLRHLLGGSRETSDPLGKRCGAQLSSRGKRDLLWSSGNQLQTQPPFTPHLDHRGFAASTTSATAGPNLPTSEHRPPSCICISTAASLSAPTTYTTASDGTTLGLPTVPCMLRL